MNHDRAQRSTVLVLLLLLLFATAPAALAGEKFTFHPDQKMDASPSPGKALIYFVRSQSFGGAIKVKLFGDGDFIGVVHRKTFIPYECEPGKHEFVVVAENAGFLEAEVEAGKIYYVLVAIHMGAMKARTHFETARAGSDALESILENKAKLRGITTTAAGLEWVKKDRQKDKKKIDKYRAKGEEFETLRPADGYAELQ